VSGGYHEPLTATIAPVRMWADPATVESGAMDQIRNVANLPWVHGVAVMPDVHFGYGATVGSVIAMRDAVSPSAVGVDIGCGMSAARVDLRAEDLPDDLGRIRTAVESTVPVGQFAHDGAVDIRKVPEPIAGPDARGWGEFWKGYDNLSVTLSTKRLGSDAYKHRVMSQLGTLGGGNHFVEVCLDEGDQVWLMLHSGSRNVGKEIAERHVSTARELPHNADLPDRDLAVFVSGSPQMDAYRRDLCWAQEYARRNRAVMMGLFKQSVRKVLDRPSLGFGETILLPPQLRVRGDLRRHRPPRHPQGRHLHRGWAAGHHPGLDENGVLHRQGSRQPRRVLLREPRRGPPNVPGAAKRMFTVADLQAQTESWPSDRARDPVSRSAGRPPPTASRPDSPR
jgi:hypothetical protein